jgi:GDSL-like lipase/acylhydrolase family protein
MSISPDFAARVKSRSGLGEAAAALSSEPRTIAYFGTSVTGSTHGYRATLHESVQQRFGQEHRSVTASVGGVGPVSALFFLDQLALRHEPVLCLVEYSGGDYWSSIPVEDISGAVDEIVTRVRGAGSTPCFLHVYRSNWNRRYDEVLAAWEQVADRRGVPTIDLASAFREAIDAGALDPREIFSDEAHPNRRGSELMASLVGRALDDLFDISSDSIAAADLGRLQAATDFSAAGVHPATLEQAGGQGTEQLFRLQLSYVQVGPEVPITYRPPGELVGLIVLIGPDSGEITVAWDGGSESELLFDEFSDYYRIGTVVLDRRIPAGSEVTVELTRRPIDRTATVRPIPQPEATEPSLRVVGWMVLG